MAWRALTLVFMALLLVGTGCSSGPVVLTIAGGSQGQELELTVQGVERFRKRHPDILVNVRPTPSSTTERLELYRSIFQSNPESVDVLQMDVVWPVLMAEHALDLNDYLRQSEIDQHFPKLIANNTVDGKLVAIPWFIDLPVLYCRRDLIRKYGFEEPPKTWAELEEMALTIQEGERQEGNLDFWGYVWQGRPYEGLTCNALEWQVSHGGGNILDAEGKPSLNNPGTAAGFYRASSWVAKISPPDIIQFDEEDSRAVWQQGNAAFMRNWTNPYSQAKQDAFLKDKLAVVTMPTGGYSSAATLGGWQLFVSRYTRYPKQAVELLRFLADEREQRRRAIDGSFAPTIPALYKDPEVLAAMPFFVSIEQILDEAVVRPAIQAGLHYDKVSQAYWEAAYDVLNGADAEQRLSQAEREIQAILQDQQ